MSEKEQVFKVKYKITAEHGQFTAKDIVTSGENFGAADALLVCSLLREGEMGLKALFFSLDWHGSPLGPVDEFKVWTFLTHRLLNSALPDQFRGILSKYEKEISDILRKGGISEEELENFISSDVVHPELNKERLN